ncbi:MAG: immunity 26/phosphotriesterase HocA family protein [Acidimicrobiia bacterium]
MSDGETNLQVLSPSRKKPKVGDVFALQLADGRYLFGRIISTDAMAGPSMGGAILIYVYRERSDQKALPKRAELRPDRLLVSPIMTNQRPWTKGCFRDDRRTCHRRRRRPRPALLPALGWPLLR